MCWLNGCYYLVKCGNIPRICHIYHIWDMWRKICPVEKFQIYTYAWQMWRNLKFLHIWHVCDVENVSTYVQFMLFSCKIDFVTIYALLSENLFCRDLRTFVWRKIEPKIASVEKKWQISGMPHHHQRFQRDKSQIGNFYFNLSYLLFRRSTSFTFWANC